MLTMHCAVLRPAASGPLTVAAPILAMRSWCWQRIDDMRAGVHQKPYMSLEVEVAGTALVGGTCASIRPTPAIMCMVLQRRRAVHAGRAPRGEERPGHSTHNCPCLPKLLLITAELTAKTVENPVAMRVSCFFLLACAGCGALHLPPMTRGGALLLPRGTAVMMAKKAAVKKDGAAAAALRRTHVAACAPTALTPPPSPSPFSTSPPSSSLASPPPWQ